MKCFRRIIVFDIACMGMDVVVVVARGAAKASKSALFIAPAHIAI
jgi:hypothetical protein